MARNKEGTFQDNLIKILQTSICPGSIVLKNDSSYIQGFPDLTWLAAYGFTAIIECKKGPHETYQPNQEYYLEYCYNELGHFTITAYPENLEEVLHELQQALQHSRRNARISRR